MKNTWGGAREGAGRPKGSVKVSADPKEPRTFRLEQSLLKLAREIGGGNTTEGIRRALKNYLHQV